MRPLLFSVILLCVGPATAGIFFNREGAGGCPSCPGGVCQPANAPQQTAIPVPPPAACAPVAACTPAACAPAACGVTKSTRFHLLGRPHRR